MARRGGRALAAFGRGKRDDTTIQELRRLRDEAKSVGLNVAIPALEKALSRARDRAISGRQCKVHRLPRRAGATLKTCHFGARGRQVVPERWMVRL